MIKLRIPCKEQFAFIEEDYEGDNPKGRFNELYQLMNGTGVSETEFCQRLEKVINSDLTAWGTVEAYNELNPSQMAVFQALKRFRKRLPTNLE